MAGRQAEMREERRGEERRKRKWKNHLKLQALFVHRQRKTRKDVVESNLFENRFSSSELQSLFIKTMSVVLYLGLCSVLFCACVCHFAIEWCFCSVRSIAF